MVVYWSEVVSFRWVGSIIGFGFWLGGEVFTAQISGGGFWIVYGNFHGGGSYVVYMGGLGGYW